MASIQTIRKGIGSNIRHFRQKAALSQEALAEKADLHPVYISQVERGTKAVSIEALWKISTALRVSLSTLLRGL